MTDAEIFKRNVKRICKEKHMINWCKSENPSVIRAQYRDAYNIIAARKKRENQLPPGLKNALNKIRNAGVGRLIENDS